MKRYIALLRGVNISGKNKVPMAELKQGFEALDYAAVKTWLNSGNVAFSSGETDAGGMAGRIGGMLRERFGVEIPVFVIAQEDMEDILQHAPGWWGGEDREIYDNLIFVIPPAAAEEIAAAIGAPKAGLERIEAYKDAIFWSFRRKDYQKTNWWPKTAGTGVGAKLTIRTANTVRKMVCM